MGLFNFIKNQFIELIEWTDTSSLTLVHPIPIANKSIKMGATLTVRESQIAVIVNEGKVADVFAPGKYRLSQENLPLLSAQKSWKFGFKAPFKTDIYYVNTKQFTSIKWETVNPIKMKTPHIGHIHLKAHGTFAFRVVSAEKFMKEVFGTNQIYDTGYVIGHLKSILIATLSDLLIETRIPVSELAFNYDEISDSAENKLLNRLAALGIELCSFIIENIIVPKQVEAAITEIATTKVVVEKSAVVTEAAIKADTEVLTTTFDTDLTAVEQESQIEPAQIELAQIQCAECGYSMTSDMKFCSDCGTGVVLIRSCSCGYKLSGAMKFCPECGVLA